MKDISSIPLFRLNKVSEETGLSPHLIRAWERRYGLPQPQRTPGGHRLYSRRDVETLRWLNNRIGEGMRISDAVTLWKDLVSRGLDPLREDALLAPRPVHLDLLREEWVRACLAFDEASADMIVAQALTLYEVETVLDRILRQGLREIGERWYHNQASIQQEHFASHIVARRLYSLISSLPPLVRAESIILGTPEGELHDLPLLFLAVALRRRGYRVIFLGAEVPKFRFKQVLQEVHPTAVILSAQWLAPVPALRDIAADVLMQGTRVGYLGRVFHIHSTLLEHIPGFFLGDMLTDVPNGIEALLSVSLPRYHVPLLDEAFRQAATALERIWTALVAYIKEQFRSLDVPIEDIHTAAYFTLLITRAALLLGDLDLLHQEIAWVKDLLRARNIAPTLLGHFCQTLAQGMTKLDNRNVEPVAVWFLAYADQVIQESGS